MRKRISIALVSLFLVALAAMMPFGYVSGQSSHGNHGTNNPNTGAAGALATYAAAGGSTIIGPDAGLSSNGAGIIVVGAVGVGNGGVNFKGTTSGSGTILCTSNTCTSLTSGLPIIISSANGMQAPRYPVGGTTFTTNAGCGEGALVGGQTAGKITTAGSTSCTDIITFGGIAAANGYQCTFTDLTTAADAASPHQTSTTTTTATWVSGTIVAADVIQFACTPY